MNFLLRNIAFLLLALPPVAIAQTNSSINPNGYNVLYYPNGIVSSEGMYRNGRPDGFWRGYHETGVLKSEGNRLNFMLDSTWVFYTHTGDTSEIINYRLGVRSGFHYQFETIIERNNVSKHYLASKKLYLDDRLEGKAYYYYPNGQVRQIVNYRNGLRQDESIEFDENGTVITIFDFRNDYMISRQFVNRTNAQGQKHGTWKEFHPNGIVKIEEHYRNGVLEGTTRFRSESGMLINEIVYRNGEIIDQGIQLHPEITTITSFWEDGTTIRRRGVYRDSIPVGFHFFFNREGKPERSIRYSEFGTGIMIGEGPVDSDENRTGDWKLYFESGELRATGKYANERQHGEWTYYSKEGKKFQVGIINNGVPEGLWTWYFPSGEIFRQEQLERNRRHGLSIQYSDSATIVSKGEYIEGERNGFWIEHIGHIREEGEYVAGFKEGVWSSYHKDGQLYHTGRYVEGHPDGKHLIYFPDGTLKEEQHYVMGRRFRNWRLFNENGSLFLTITYIDDRETRINGIRIDR